MFGYIGDLRTMTSGRGQFSMEFSHYAPCPKNVSDDVIAKAKAKDEALRAASKRSTFQQNPVVLHGLLGFSLF